MKTAPVGAPGYVGSRLLEEAVKLGHAVTAITRSPHKVPWVEDHAVAMIDELEDPKHTGHRFTVGY